MIRSAVLLFFSVYFYYKTAGDLMYFPFIVAAISYVFGFLLHKAYGNEVLKKILVWSGSLALLGLLGYYKYTNFFLEQWSSFRNTEFTALNIIVPLGISYYIFKAMSYVFDMYYERIEQPILNPLYFSLYILFFPTVQLGPLDRADEFTEQLKVEPVFTKQLVGSAVLLLITGLIKKAIVADYLGINFVDRVFDSPLKFTGVENLMALYAYTIQFYCDFSGYTDLALGVGLLLGIKIRDNFNFPYKADSLAEFWRRWHMSFSAWLLDYLFTPLQLTFRRMRNYGTALALFITFVLCGLWHGASMMFILWGAAHGGIMAVSFLTQKFRKNTITKMGLGGSKILHFLRVVFTFHLVTSLWILFRSPSLEIAGDVLSQITTYFKPEVLQQFVFDGYGSIVLTMLLGLTTMLFPKFAAEKGKELFLKMPEFLYPLLLALVIYISIQVRSADLVPFIYFQF